MRSEFWHPQARDALTFVRADELGHRQHMPLDRLLQVGLSGTRAEVKIAVEGVQAEDVAMAPVPRWRAGATVATRSEVISSLPGRRLSLPQSARAWGESPGDPVREDTARRVRIVDEERQRPCLVWGVRPAKRRREILTVAGVSLRDRLRVFEGAGLEGELAHQQVRWSAAAVRRGSSSP